MGKKATGRIMLDQVEQPASCRKILIQTIVREVLGDVFAVVFNSLYCVRFHGLPFRCIGGKRNDIHLVLSIIGYGQFLTVFILSSDGGGEIQPFAVILVTCGDCGIIFYILLFCRSDAAFVEVRFVQRDIIIFK